MSERERFEAAVGDEYPLERDSVGNYNYRDQGAIDAWQGWQAAMANDHRRSVQDSEDLAARLLQVKEKLSPAGSLLEAVAIQKSEDIIDALNWSSGKCAEGGTAGAFGELLEQGRKLRESQAAS
jgi:hypothetical protein